MLLSLADQICFVLLAEHAIGLEHAVPFLSVRVT
jgi:hypothetical protein